MTWRTTGAGEVKQGLYHLITSKASSPSSPKVTQNNYATINLASNQHFDLWYFRLGHPSLNRLNFLGNVNIRKTENQKPCFIYPLAKQHRLPFPISKYRTQRCFDLVHCDVWGPCNEISYDGFRYFLTIVDDFSRCTWVHLLKNKSDVHSMLQSFYTMIQTQFDVKIKIIRSDNGEEFDLKEFYKRNGIIHHKNCVEIP